MAKIVLTKIARLDLKEIVDYIKRDSVKYAILEKKKIEEAIEKIPKQPFSNKVFADLNDENIRELVFRNYRIICEITPEKQINILTIHHHSRLIANNPAFNDEE